MSENERMVQEINRLGGYVYPSEVKLYNGSYSAPGLTVRDYFAAEALAGMMSNPDTFKHEKGSGPDLRKRLAAACYELADAMLEARK